MVAFNQVTMEWMVVSCVRMTKEDHNAYALGFRKSFENASVIMNNLKLANLY